MRYKRYIARRRARFQCVFEGMVNIPWGTVVECRDGLLYLGDKLLCAARSQTTKDFFVQDDDGQGKERGRLVTAILARLGPQEAQKGASAPRWEKVWADPRCRPYKQPQHEEHWLWNESFYNAPIEDLRYIAALVGAKI